MDELKITGKFMTGLISRLISRMVYTKCGCDADIHINSINATIIDGRTHIHMDIEGDIDNRELEELLKGVGI